ncbi:MAG: hypothetical protein ACRDY2_02975 [Acidimicrobiales bacterium]
MTIVASIAAALAGGWLMVAPFALGYRKAGAAWNHPTEVDFWTGVAVVALALVGLAASLVSIRAELRQRGALASPPSRDERRERKATARAAAAAAKAATLAERAAVAAGQGQGPLQGGPVPGPGGPGHGGPGPGGGPGGPGSPGGPGGPGGQPTGSPTSPDLRELLAPLVQALLTDLDSGGQHGQHGQHSGEPETEPESGNHQTGPAPGAGARLTPRSYS